MKLLVLLLFILKLYARINVFKNKVIMEATISYIKNPERFSGSLFE